MPDAFAATGLPMADVIIWVSYALCLALACGAFAIGKRAAITGSAPSKALRIVLALTLASGSLFCGALPSLLGTCCGATWGSARAALLMAERLLA